MCVSWFTWHLRWTPNTLDFEEVEGLSRWKTQSKQRWDSLLLGNSSWPSLAGWCTETMLVKKNGSSIVKGLESQKEGFELN